MDVTDHSLSMLSLFVSAKLLNPNKNPQCKELFFPTKLFRPGLPVAWRGSQEQLSSPSDLIIIFFASISKDFFNPVCYSGLGFF